MNNSVTKSQLEALGAVRGNINGTGIMLEFTSEDNYKKAMSTFKYANRYLGDKAVITAYGYDEDLETFSFHSSI